MRQRATATSPSPWRTADTYISRGGYSPTILSGEGNDSVLRAWLPTFSNTPWDKESNAWANVDHMAAWDPPTADMLDKITNRHMTLETGRCIYCSERWPCSDFLDALRVARAYLGETDD